MHVSQPEIGFKYFPVDKAFEEYFLNALAECPSEESSLKSELVGTGKCPEPDYTSGHRINQDEIEANIKRYYKRIKLHFSIFFEKLPLQVKSRFLY